MELRRLDLNLLLLLDALFEQGTITRAAVKLQMSQPTASASLAKLRTLMGDELFFRSKGLMVPTERAMELRAPLAQALKLIQTEILGRANITPGGYGDVFSLSVSDIGELEFLPRLLARLEEVAPNARIKATICRPDRLAEALDEGSIDLALGYFPDLQASFFKQQMLFAHEAACIVRSDHPVIGDNISLAQYEAARHLVVRQESRVHDVIESAILQRGIRRDAAVTISHYVNAPTLVAQSDLIATIARPLACRFSEFHPIKVLRLPFEMPAIEVKQVWHTRFHNSPRLIWLRGLIASISQNRPHLGTSDPLPASRDSGRAGPRGPCPDAGRRADRASPTRA